MTQNTTIIGFGYRARHGKDSAIAEIVKRYPELVKRYAFATPLRSETNALYEMYGGWERVLNGLRNEGVLTRDNSIIKLPDWVQYDPNGEVNEHYPYGKQRQLLQWWGTEYRRNTWGDNYWVDQALTSIDQDNVPFALMADMRFPNEAAACDFSIHVFRPGIPIPEHESEHALDNWGFDYTIRNDRSLEYLQIVAVEIFSMIRRGVLSSKEFPMAGTVL